MDSILLNSYGLSLQGAAFDAALDAALDTANRPGSAVISAAAGRAAIDATAVAAVVE